MARIGLDGGRGSLDGGFAGFGHSAQAVRGDGAGLEKLE